MWYKMLSAWIEIAFLQLLDASVEDSWLGGAQKHALLVGAKDAGLVCRTKASAWQRSRVAHAMASLFY